MKKFTKKIYIGAVRRNRSGAFYRRSQPSAFFFLGRNCAFFVIFFQKKNTKEVQKLTADKNLKRLGKAYDRLCAVTCSMAGGIDDSVDIKFIKDAFAAVKEGVNIGQLLAKSEQAGSSLTVKFENGADELSK